jgi:REP element-mobilizing transposase RayT
MPFYRRKLPHLQRDFKRHFVTFCTYQRWLLPDWARAIALRSCLHDNEVMHFLHVALVMPDHVHLIFTPLINEPKNEFYSLAQVMCRIKVASGQLIHQQMNRLGRVWQTESFDHVLRSSESLDAKIAYILENPVRARLVSHWKDYPWIWVREVESRRDSPLGCPGDAKRAEAVLRSMGEAEGPKR